MKRIAALILLASMSANAFAFQPFVASDIRIDGLSRITAGTVLNYLPLSKGDRVTDADVQRAIRALYQTKFFSDVEMERDGNILVIKVVERPSIAKLTIRGNKDIKTDELKKGLKGIGLAEGETFDRLALDNVQQELVRQYYNRGKYNVSVIPHVVQLDRNRVAIDIEIREGKAAKIQEINIVGNHAFTDKEIRTGFESNTPNWLSWYSKDDQYSREKLSGDLQKLQSYYMDRGYADFGVDSTQVSISPDKRDMYVDANIKEGAIYKVSDVKLLGKLVLPEATLRQLVFLKVGDTFNRAAIESSTKAIKAILANIGYAYAKVTPIPKLDKAKRTVAVTLYVEPGDRVYVRRIVFSGNTRTEDGVLRREMRQLEGSWYSQAALDRSKTRLMRLGYFKTVDIDKKLVPGTTDQVDVTVKVEEQSAGSMQFGIGYSQYAGLILNASVSENNIFGSGDSFSISAQRSDITTSETINYYNPYLTDDGIGIGYTASYSKTDFGNTDAEFVNYATSAKSFSTYLGIPISETDGLRAGLGISSNKVNLFPGLSPQILIDYIDQIGNQTAHAWTGTLGWTHDTRDQYWAPSRGGVLSLSTNVALPGSTVQYWQMTAEASHYWRVGLGFVLYLDGQLGYGKTYGTNGITNAQYDALNAANLAVDPTHAMTDMREDYPFWQNYYSGGVSDVRGFQDNTLGPRVCIATDAAPLPSGLCPDGTYAQPIGGAFKVLGHAQLFIPLPFLKNVNTARVSWFVDVGNVYKNYQSFNASTLRASTGLALNWQAPVGPLIISLGVPFRTQPGDNHYEERLQFTFGSQF